MTILLIIIALTLCLVIAVGSVIIADQRRTLRSMRLKGPVSISSDLGPFVGRDFSDDFKTRRPKRRRSYTEVPS